MEERVMKTRVTAILPSGEKQYDTIVSLKSLMCYMVFGNTPDTDEALKKAINALSQQIAKLPAGTHCPKCKGTIVLEGFWFNYCQYCGQRIALEE